MRVNLRPLTACVSAKAWWEAALIFCVVVAGFSGLVPPMACALVLALRAMIGLAASHRVPAAGTPLNEGVDPRLLLGREEFVEPLGPLATCYAGASVLVTGAGGSIGSDLCKRILDAGPARLVLFDMSEPALYAVDHAVRREIAARGLHVDVVAVLGSVLNAGLVDQVLRDHSVSIVLHAAAYKHVPMVEQNPLAGLANNVLGTQSLAQSALRAGVDRFVLVSSDKAVRPASVMGVSKRMAELVVQDLDVRGAGGPRPIFASVRFGNVLGSSGSVLPLFQHQLRQGEPLTVTHPQVTRYFMTVREASQLVLRAGAMARGGEVFVLSMGQPVRIAQLARRLIRHAAGHVPITYTGLRTGDKLNEELSASGVLGRTSHGKILCAQDPSPSRLEIARAVRDLRCAVDASDEQAARALAAEWIKRTARDVPKQTAA